MSSPYPDLPHLRGTVLPCMVIDEHRLVINPTMNDMSTFVVNPRLTEDAKLVSSDSTIRDAAAVRQRGQRPLTNKAKRDNVPRYRDYLERGMVKGEVYVTPPQSLVFLQALRIYQDAGMTYVHIPSGARGIHDDGETQYLGRLDLLLDHPETGNVPMAVVVDHGRTIEWAGQAFYDLNMLAVAVPDVLGITADSRDAATNLAKEMVATMPALHGKVSFESRQLSNKGEAVMTISTLRRAVAASLVGKRIFSLNNRPLDEEITPERREEVIRRWQEIFALFSGELTRDSVLVLPVVLTVIGIALAEADTKAKVDLLTVQMMEVRWDKSTDVGARRWAGIAGRLTDAGKFSSAGGVKDSGYRVLAALTDQASEHYKTIRA